MKNSIYKALILLSLYPSFVFAEEIKMDKESIVITFQDNIVTLDPAIGYDWQNTSIINSLFSGLMKNTAHSNEPVLDLAKSYTLSSDGLIYTFILRDNIQFHNQRPVVAEDIKYSIERVVNPKLKSPGQVFFQAIKGYEAVKNGLSNSLSGIKVIDQHTIQFKLSHPSASFLYALGIHFSSVVPKEEILQHGNQYFGIHPVGTGSYIFKEMVSDKLLVIERNPDYHIKELKMIKRIQFLMGISPKQALALYKKGQVDILGDEIPSGDFNRMINDPEFNKLILEERRQFKTSYISFNTSRYPFDQLKVRQAVNMAINKNKITQLTDNRATQASQILPPGMAGYNPRYLGYPFDQQKAKLLLAEAGFPQGFQTTLHTIITEPNPSIGNQIKADLALIGINVTVQSLPQNKIIAIGAAGIEEGMIWSGGIAWGADYPAPSNFYFPILSCTQGNWNWALYCNPEIEKLALKAEAMVFPEQRIEREKLWGSIFSQIMDDAPWVPIFNTQKFILHSKRLYKLKGNPLNSNTSTTGYHQLRIYNDH